MTPGARIQAAIDILDELAGDGTTAQLPVDRILSGYFRQRRYAGSKDRRWVADFIYDLLRCRAVHEWRGAGGVTRKLAISQLRQMGRNADEIVDLFNGDKFAATPLDVEETEFLNLPAAQTTTLPDWVAGNYPEWLAGELSAAFGEDLPRHMAALNQRAPVNLRINPLRPTKHSIAVQLRSDTVEVEKGRYAPLCLRLTRGRLEQQQLYRSGQVEVQDESSQLAVLASHAKSGQQVVDFCAGAGGKSLALAAMMENRGQIYALDVDGRRLEELKSRAKRANARNIQPHVISAKNDDPWLLSHAGEMAVVFVDAPCSGLGTWRRNPDAPWRLQPQGLADYVTWQAEILRRAAGLVQSGGILIYAVCSMLPSEGPEQVRAFLHDFPDFQFSGPMPNDPVELEAGEILLNPADHGCDGFYFARLKRT